MRRARLRMLDSNVRSYYALHGPYNFAIGLILPINAIYLLHIGLSEFETFLSFAIFSAGVVVFEIPTGAVADVLGRRISFIAAAAVQAGGTVLYLVLGAFMPVPWLFYLVSLLLAVGNTLHSGALESWFVDSVRAEDPDVNIRSLLGRSEQVRTSSILLGTLAGGIMAQATLGVPFVARAIVMGLVCLLALAIMDEVELGRDRPSTRKSIAAQAVIGIAVVRDHPVLRKLLAAEACRIAFIGWGMTAAMPYLLELVGSRHVWVTGVVTALLALSGLVGNQVVRRLVNRGDGVVVVGAGMVATGIAAVGLGFPIGTVPVAVLLAVISFTGGILVPTRRAVIHGRIDEANRATVLSVDGLVSSFGRMGGLLALGAIAERESLASGYLVGALVVAVGLLPLLAAASADSILNRRKATTQPGILHRAGGDR